ncbi:MAG TPA: tRNA glutamyl-Q(34) synthetase GluQRS [Verrucomicrobiae bacterium]|nr:tRNA glutamyl-Q(34) synthetase GluQRS [Verrucomicrobiae bacterium]
MSTPESKPRPYRGRLAPSPTGYLHLGHARTFWTAQRRACENNGTLVLRIEDLDRSRCRPNFVTAMFEDLAWFGFKWQEGPDVGGLFGPYSQSERMNLYRSALQQLQQSGYAYRCSCSRQDVLRAVQAPHQGEDEPLYPGTCRPKSDAQPSEKRLPSQMSPSTERVNWRFRVSDGETIQFVDLHYGPQVFVAGTDFGDFVVWRHDNVPAYHLAVVVDDAAMQISEVVRGADLLKSTARQLLLYRALGWSPPDYFHCPILTDEQGVRLAKRHDALSLRALRAQGADPKDLRKSW